MQRVEFPRVTPESVGVPSEAVGWLLDQLENGYTEPHGLMLMRHGKVFAEGWWRPYAPGIRHGLQSHSKTYAATAVGVLYTEGGVRLDERIIDIFPDKAPEEPSENLKLLTVRDVLCMGCGMDEMPSPAAEDWIREFLNIPVNHRPGTVYMYNSVGSSLLCAIVRRRTGMSMHEYLIPRLYEPLGILYRNHRWYTMSDGTEAGGWGLFATTEDNLRLMKLYLDGGVAPDGRRILAEDFVRLATTDRNPSASEEAKNPGAWDNYAGYGFQIWMCRPEGVYRADGAMGQFTVVVPDMDMILAITETACFDENRIREMNGTRMKDSGMPMSGTAQHTLDVFWGFLSRIPGGERFAAIKPDPAFLASPAGSTCIDFGGEVPESTGRYAALLSRDGALPENPEAALRLASRMSALALPRPVWTPAGPLAEKISGRVMAVEDGTLGLMVNGFAQRADVGKERLSLEFTGAGECIFTYEQAGPDGQEKRTVMNAALDGSERWNRVGDPAGTVSEVLLSGRWISENEFEITMRFIETCGTRRVCFAFGESEAVIRTKSNMAFSPAAEVRAVMQ